MNYRLQDLIDMGEFQVLQDRLNEIYSFPSAIIDNDGNILTATAWQDICTKFHRQHKDCEKECIKSDQYIIDHIAEANPAVSYRCPHGLADNATPIIIEGVHLGNFFTGQFFMEEPDLEFFRAQARKYGFDEPAYLDAVKKVPIWAQEQLNSYLFFIKGLIGVISGTALKNLRAIESRQKAEESEKQLQAMFSSASIGIAQADPGTRQWVRVNRKMCEITGYTPEEMLTLRVSDITHPDDLAADAEAFARVVQGVQPNYHMEKRYVRKDKSIVWVNVNMTVIRDDAGQPVGTMATVEDITERKRGEEALRESEERLRLTSEAGKVGLWDWDLLSNQVRFSPACKHQLGFEDHELLDEFGEWESRLHPDDHDPALARVHKVVSEGLPRFENEFRLLHKDGTYRTILAQASVLCDGAGKPYRMLGSHIDITERKRMEDALRTSEERFRRTFDDAPIGTAIVGLDHRFVSVNQALCRITGYSSEELTALTFEDITHPEDLAKDAEQIRRLSLGEIDVYKTDKRYIQRDGAVVWGRLSVRLIKDEAGRPLYLLPIMEDITERKRVEDALRESDEIFNQLLKHSPVYVFFKDDQARALRLSANFENMLGRPVSELIGKTMDELFPSDFARKMVADDLHVLKEGKEVALEEEFGGRFYTSVKFPIHVEGKARYLAGYTIDITERKRAADALRASEERFRSYFELPLVGIAITSPEKGWVEVNDRLCEILGYSLEELRDMTWAEITHPDDLAADLALFSRVMAGEIDSYSIEKRFLRPDGRALPTELSVRCIRKSDGSIDHFVVLIQDISERKKAEDALRESEEKFARVFHAAPVLIAVTDLSTGLYVDVNDEALRISGFARDEVIGHMPTEIGWITPEGRDRLLSELGKHDRIVGAEMTFRAKNGARLDGLVNGERITIGEKNCLLTVTVDVTERKRAEEEKSRLEEQLKQSQKLESVGRLAGGVAHDFNNMLGVILGHAELVLGQIDSRHEFHSDLREIHTAATRSADLTRQLLAFARKQTVAPKVQDLNETVADMLKMLQRLIGEDVHLVWKPGANLWKIKVDPSQIDQIMANLCVNARDAISDVGKITIETRNSAFDEEYCSQHVGFAPGEYVRISVSDNGCGMDKEMIAQIFEPFFTTKGVGKGTGLGLATVYGAVKQNKGFINVYSEPGSGTTFSIYLPRHEVAPDPSQIERVVLAPARGRETILLVEDELSILRMTKLMLEKHGYTVLSANTPGEAIRLAREHVGVINLLMTDVVMPEMNGRALARNLLSLYPGLKRLFMSGYTADVIADHGVLDDGVCFIQKPFNSRDLAGKVRQALDEA